MNQTKILTIYDLLEKNHNNQSIVAECVGCSRQYVSWVLKNYGEDKEAFIANRNGFKERKKVNSVTNDQLRAKVIDYLANNKNHVTKKDFAVKAGLSSSYLSLFLGGYSISDKKRNGIIKAMH